MRREHGSGEREVSGTVKFDISYTGEEAVFVLPRGYYFLQCWGAQGGGKGSPGKQSTGSTAVGGWGGYSEGYLTLEELTPVYVYVGGEGLSGGTATTTGVLGGFNGGGRTFGVSGFSGGGASDIRIGSNSLYSRVIVAGGGGGYGVGRNDNTLYDANGGNGGGYYGAKSDGDESINNWYSGSRGATQTHGGDVNAGFGYGADSLTAKSGSYYLYASAGGGGWYGGGSSGYATSTSHSYNWNPNGAGGTGYIYNATSAVSYPAGCLLNPSYYLENGHTFGGAILENGTNGNFSFPTSAQTSATETGHRGNGFARISGITKVLVPEEITNSGIVVSYTESGVYTPPEWATKADIFLVNGGNAGSGVTGTSQNGYGGQGGHYFSATNISCLGHAANITIGNGGVYGTNVMGGQTILSFGGNSYSPQEQSNIPKSGTTGTTARSGVKNSVDPTDTNLYGAFGGRGQYNSSTGYTGGNTGGGRGAGANATLASGATQGSFYGAGGGGGAYRGSSYGGNRPGANGYQGIAIVRYKPA